MLSLKLLFFHFSLQVATVIILSISDHYSFHFNPFIYWFQVLSKNEKEYSGLFNIYRKRKDWVGYFQPFTVVILFSSSFTERFFFSSLLPWNFVLPPISNYIQGISWARDDTRGTIVFKISSRARAYTKVTFAHNIQKAQRKSSVKMTWYELES